MEQEKPIKYLFSVKDVAHNTIKLYEVEVKREFEDEDEEEVEVELEDRAKADFSKKISPIFEVSFEKICDILSENGIIINSLGPIDSIKPL